MAAKPQALSPEATEALKLWEDGCVKHHDQFRTQLRHRYDAYYGILDARARAADWYPRQHPPIINHIVEVTMAGLVDPKLAFRVRPKPRLWNEEDGEYERLAQGARAHEILHHCQLKEDRFHEKLRPFALQDAVAGLTVAKTSWRRDKIRRPRLRSVDEEVAPGFSIPRLRETMSYGTGFDGPTTEVVNVEDFYWHEAATELQRSPIVAHRVWMHWTELKANEWSEANPGGFRNVDDLKESRDLSAEKQASPVQSDADRSKDMVEVLEIWWRTPAGLKVVTLGNRKVEIRPARDNPFWHGEYPFVVCSTRPDMFRIPGMSQVEKIRHLQDMHWDLSGQTMENVRLVNNAILMFRSDVDDPDAFPFEPGARWLVEDPAQIVPWTPAPIGDMALPHLARLEKQMQDYGGSQPFTTTSEARTQGADTATEAALITNLAQQSTMKLKEQLNFAYERIGQQRTELNQQFIRRRMLVEKVGIDSEYEQETIEPLVLQGSYLFDITPMSESLMRSERRAESNALMQMWLQILPVAAALSQVGAATPLNLDEIVKDWAEKNDIGGVERFFSQKPQPQGVAPPGPPSGVPPADGGQGVTNASAATSDLVQNPVAAMQQMQAKVGGLNNS